MASELPEGESQAVIEQAQAFPITEAHWWQACRMLIQNAD